jgi:putative membrane protein
VKPMSLATLYSLVTVLHISADIVFVLGLLAGALLLAALSFQDAASIARDRRLISAMARWHRAATGPALVVAWVCGLWLAWTAGWFHSGWLHAKLALVLLLSGLHGPMGPALRRLAGDAPQPPARGWRVVPPLATAVAAAIGWLALLKPF